MKEKKTDDATKMQRIDKGLAEFEEEVIEDEAAPTKEKTDGSDDEPPKPSALV